MTPPAWPLWSRPMAQDWAVGCDCQVSEPLARSGSPPWVQKPGVPDPVVARRLTAALRAVTEPYTGESNGSPLGNAVVLPHDA